MQTIRVEKVLNESVFTMVQRLMGARYGLTEEGGDFGGSTSYSDGEPSPTGFYEVYLNDGVATGFATALLNGIGNPTCIASGLNITTNFGTFIVDDVHAVVADPALETRAKVSIVLEKSTWTASVVVFEKTDGEYDSLPSTHALLADLKEFSVPAVGTDLVELNDWIK